MVTTEFLIRKQIKKRKDGGSQTFRCFELFAMLSLQSSVTGLKTAVNITATLSNQPVLSNQQSPPRRLIIREPSFVRAIIGGGEGCWEKRM